MEIDERYFEMANTEFEHNRNSALWTKCLTLAEGNETTTRYKYINEVAHRLGGKGEHPTPQRNRPIDDGAGFPRKFIRGNFGMTRTFWFGLVGYCLIRWMIAAGIRIATMSMSPSARQTLEICAARNRLPSSDKLPSGDCRLACKLEIRWRFLLGNRNPVRARAFCGMGVRDFRRFIRHLSGGYRPDLTPAV